MVVDAESWLAHWRASQRTRNFEPAHAEFEEDGQKAESG
jgi:hypothetical protein